jgi:hypothetical protein
MPISYRIESPSGVILIDVVGEVPIEAYSDLWEELMADERISSGPRILADFRKVEVRRTGAEVRSVAATVQRFRAFAAGGRMAVIADQPASFGLARMYETLVEPTAFEVRVFRDPDEARAWIDPAD